MVRGGDLPGKEQLDLGGLGRRDRSSQGRGLRQTGEGPWNGAARSWEEAFAGDGDCEAENGQEVPG